MNGDEVLVFNGINGENGDYLFPPMKPEDITEQAKKKETDEDKETQAALRARRDREDEGSLGTVYDVGDPTDLSQAGWGIIFAEDDEEAPLIREALSELLEHRQEQATKKKEHYYRELSYKKGATKAKFLLDYDAEPFGEADPEKMPYYLLIAGDPAKIPYGFQYQLDVQYAVGRIHFNAIADYAQYAHNVVQAETGQLDLARKAAFFGVQNHGDRPTELSSEELVLPLADKLSKDRAQWQIRKLLADEATKNQLGKLMGGEETPTLLFTASHGVGFPTDDDLQRRFQGALLCQDWPGRLDWDGPLSRDHYFGAEDLTANAQMLGLIAIHFACYGAGTPLYDDFAHHRGLDASEKIARQAFVASLPQAALTRGALAVLGHVERAWTYSFRWQGVQQTRVFEDLFKEIMDGRPVGQAMERFDSRYASQSTNLTYMLDKKIRKGQVPDHVEFSRLWTANNDARNYVIVGDPAVRLSLPKEGKEAKERPEIAVAAVSEVGEEAPAAVIEKTLSTEIPPVPGQEEDEAYISWGKKKKDEQAAEAASEEQAKLTDSLLTLTKNLGDGISKWAADTTSLEVKTYTSSDLTTINFDNKTGKFTGPNQPTPRAMTFIKWDGDITAVIPEGDQELWEIHSELVRQAQANRAAIVEAVLSALSSLIPGAG